MQDLFSVRNKRILITGAAGGLGAAFAAGLLQAGARVILNGRNRARLLELQKALGGDKTECPISCFDITRPKEVNKAVDRIERDIGPVDALINNAGLSRRGPLETLSDQDWRTVLSTNLDGLFYVSREIARRMINRRQGKIVNIASLMSEAARPTTGPYAASKGGVKMLTKAMAAEWGRYNIQCNAIGPGYFITPMTRKLAEDRAFSAWVKKRTPAGRWGRTQDLLGTCIFLCSKASDFINGQVVYVDGGLLSQL